MYNDALNYLKTQILSAQVGDAADIRSLIKQRLDQALTSVDTNDYVEDCLFQITEALEQLDTGSTDPVKLRDYLLGAIEALRDELHLCDIEP
ncbi:MAG: hypothetical protein ACK4ZJ_14145, partial [Allorhizobium sp.]